MSQQTLLSALDSELREQAVDLSLYGVKEYCFPASVGRRVLSALLMNGMVVLGGDLWIVRGDGSFVPGHDNWYADRSIDESFDDRSARVVQQSDSFFERNEDDQNCMVTFVVER